MASIFDWPQELKNHGMNMPYLEGTAASAGVSLFGQSRKVAGDAGRWRYKLQTMIWRKRPGETADKVLAFRALMAKTNGTLGAIRVPFFDASNVYTANGNYAPAQQPFSDGTLFTDGTGWVNSEVGFSALANAAQGATSLQGTWPNLLQPAAGQWFSDGNYAYQISGIFPLVGNGFRVSFVPRLRASITAGQILSLNKIYCIMQLQNEDAQHASMSLAQVAQIELDFAEFIQ